MDGAASVMETTPMNSLFSQHESCVLALLTEMTDSNGKHMEYKDKDGKVFLKMAKVYKKGGFLNLFPADRNVHGEMKDT